MQLGSWAAADGPITVKRVHPDTSEWTVRGFTVISGGAAFVYDYEATFDAGQVACGDAGAGGEVGLLDPGFEAQAAHCRPKCAHRIASATRSMTSGALRPRARAVS